MLRATMAKDTAYDGIFFACVKTTGIFCRPSCPARKPLPRNIVFHASVRECLLDGYRPCKRCRPLANVGSAGPWLDRLLAAVEADPSGRVTDADLRAMDISPYRARRHFQQHFGLTFQAYHRARRMGLALGALRRGADSAAVGYDHGFESASGFREAFERTFGTTPGRSADVTCIHSRTLESPLGPLVSCATDAGVCLLEFADRPALERQLATLRRRLRGAIVPGGSPHLDHLERELAEYFDGARADFTVPLLTPGTPFQERVWKTLRTIPPGETRSYDWIARTLGRPGGQRAVGRANGDNRVAIVVPCHRVVRTGGALGGYGGGVWRKRFLLDLEAKTLVEA
ncbi:MAG: bifunctional transcriptional activator/DNA repair protein Ada [Phycisphaerales bacterium]|nr:bifunctional transcriptional activator/DNA repair protein Ada [Phycisphaerales bacterium]